MFRSVATKIAHNSTLPSLGVSKDLRPLQDLITAEKSVLNSLQHLSNDIAKASDALKAWGMGEGDDLGDILTASNALLLHFVSALSTLARHESQVREQLKSVRTREEHLDELRKRRKGLMSKADDAERRLSKMSPDHKNLQMQTDHLNRLKEEIRIMDTDIMTEEASLGDFKRTSAKTCMGLKFGGLVELSEKGVIVGELGKLIIAEIPTEATEPGLPRPYYSSHARTEFYVGEAQRMVYNVGFSAEPNPQAIEGRQPAMDLPSLPSTSQEPLSDANEGYSPSGEFPQPPSGPAAYSNGLPVSRLSASMASPMSPGSGYTGLPPVSENTSESQQDSFNPDSLQPNPSTTGGGINEFGQLPPGAMPQPMTMRDAEGREISGYTRGPRFATFPVKAAGPRPNPNSYAYNTTGSPRISSTPLQLGDRPPSLDVDREPDSFSSSVAEALGERLSSDRPGQPPPFPPRRAMTTGGVPYGVPPPTYSPPAGPPPPAPSHQFHVSNQSESDQHTQHVQHARFSSEIPSVAEAEDGEASPSLAYLANAEADESDTSLPKADRTPTRVEWQGSEDPNAHENNTAHEEQYTETNTRSAGTGETEPPSGEAVSIASPVSESHSDGGEIRGRRSIHRVAPPQISPPVEVQEPLAQDETTLNAAAAREVSREMDSLMFSSPPLPAVPAARTPSPLVPPQRPFAHRAVSPRPPFDTAPPASSYVRERDRTMGSPTSMTSNGDQIPPAPAHSRLSSDRGGASPSPPSSPLHAAPGAHNSMSSISNGSTPYRTPTEYPTPTAPTASFYNLPSISTGSHSSFTSPMSPGTRTISAAAFRRPQMRTVSQPALDPEVPGAADTSPLVVKKRPLPASPYPSRGPGLGPQGSPMGRVPSAPPPMSTQQDTGSPPPDYRSRSASMHVPEGGPASSGHEDFRHSRPMSGADEEEFDYISAYTGSSPGNGAPHDDRPSSQGASGYGEGRFATNLEDESLR